MVLAVDNSGGDFWFGSDSGRLPFAVTKAIDQYCDFSKDTEMGGQVLRLDSPSRVLNNAHPPRLAEGISDQPTGAHPSQTGSFHPCICVVLLR